MELRLREILAERGMTIKEFADRLGVATSSLPINRGYATSLSKLEDYARVLNVEPWDLLYNCGAPLAPAGRADGGDAQCAIRCPYCDEVVSVNLTLSR